MKFWQFSTQALASLLAAVSVVQAGGPASGEAAADPDSAVVQLSTNEYKEFIDSNPLVLAEFFAPWCGYCKMLGPEFSKAANSLNETHPNIKLVQIDCTAEEELCAEHGIPGYPTLKVLRGSVLPPEDYDGPRNAEGIAEYMIKQSLPAVSIPEAVEELEEFIESQASPFFIQVLPSGYNAAKDKLKFNETFSNIANEYRKSMGFLSTQNSELIDNLKQKFKNVNFKNLKKPLYFLSHPKLFDDAVHYVEDFDKENLEKFIKQEMVPYFGDINRDTYMMYTTSTLPLAYYFYNTKEQRDAVEDVINKLAKKYRGKINFVGLDANLYGRHAEILNMDPEVVPLFAIQNTEENKKYGISQEEFPEGPTSESIEKFVEDFFADSLKPLVKSEDLPTEEEVESNPVTKLVAHNHDEIIGDVTKDVFVKYYANWCGHCKRLAPVWEELAALYKANPESNVIIANIDQTLNDVNPPVEIRGFPTLVLYPAHAELDEKTGLKKPIVFEGATRELDSFIDFIKEKGYHKVDANEFKKHEEENESNEANEEEKEDTKQEGHDEL